MGQSIVRRDTKVFQGTAASGGGTFVATLDTSTTPFTDQVVRIQASVYLTQASASHLANAAALIAEYVVENQNNTVTAVAAIAASANPDNSGGLVGSRVEVADTAMNTSTANWTIASNKATLTVTNNGTGSVNANVTVVMQIEQVGST